MAKKLNISERGVRGRIERLRENNLCENTIHLVGRYAQERVNEKDLIIRGIEEGSELWKAEYDNCRAILTELVYLKTLKDSKGKTEEYNQRQPLVWIAAKKFLEKYQHGQY
jgi:DNA-binding Lrp family transcriptional regulator